MKAKTFALAATGALLASGAANAVVTHIGFELNQEAVLLDGLPRNVWRLYAYTNEANDVVVAQSGQGLNNPTALGGPGNAYHWSNDLVAPFDNLGLGGFWNSGFGGDRAIFTEAIINAFPTVLQDTYMTIGLESGIGNGPDASSFAPGTSVNLADTFTMSSGTDGLGALFITPADAQGEPDAQGRVLLAQITTLVTEHVSVGMNVDWNNDARGAGFGYFTTSTVPAPGALALLGVAGLIGRRRRRG